MEPKQHILCLDGLRGLLALWVLGAHVLVLSGFPSSSDTLPFWERPLLLIRHGGIAVDVFIILSGFVISMLIEQGKEPYGIYLLRRFLRVWPVMMVCLVAAIVLAPAALQNTVLITDETARASEFAAVQSAGDHLLRHFFSHALLLHGLIPLSFLPNSATAFLPPAWSISLEWQFYAVCPLALALCRQSKLHFLYLAFIGVITFLIVNILGFPLGRQFTAAFLPVKLIYFLIGIASYFLYLKRVEFARYARYWPLACLLCVAAAGDPGPINVWFSPCLGLCIWIPVFCLFIEDAEGGGNRSRLISLLNSRTALFLGKISYPIYLAHWPSIIAVQWLIASHTEPRGTLSLALLTLAGTVPLTLISAYFLHVLVEKPGIDFGAFIKRRYWNSRLKTVHKAA